MCEVFWKVGLNDFVFLYFLGYGLKGVFLLIDFDGVFNKLYYEEVNVILSKSKVKLKLCIVDVCYFGSLLVMCDGKYFFVLYVYYEFLV